MRYQSLFKHISLSIVLCFVVNFIYFTVVEDRFNLKNLFQKSVGYNYLSLEPYFVRLRKVDYFEIQCSEADCMPLSKIDPSRIIFINKIKYKLDKSGIVFVPLSISDSLFLDLRFYINNPIFVDTKSLGMSYYADKEYLKFYKNRFALAYSYELCDLKNEKYIQTRKKFIEDIFNIFKLNKNSICKTPIDLNLKFNKENIRYIIDIKLPKVHFKEKFCEGKFCLYIIK